jgi:3-oxoacyl-[acyl-carrier-protein] synthase-3
MYVPERVVTNEELEHMLKKPGTAEWLVQNVGIQKRHIMGENETTSDLCYKASIDALNKANIQAEEIDLIILSTDTPDYLSPATSVVVQHKLEAKNAGTFDINSACAGLVTAIDIGARYLQTDHEMRKILVLGAYGMTKFLNWNDHYTATLFADGAGALILESSKERDGFLASKLIANGKYHDYLGIFVGGTAEPPTIERIQNQEHHVSFRKRFPSETNIQFWPTITRDCLKKVNLTPDDVDFL